MRIGVVTPYFYPAWEYGGTPRAAFELARALAARGHQLRVLTTGSRTETKTLHGIRVLYYRNLSSGVAFKHRLFMPLGFRLGLRQQLTGCDVLHIHEFRSTLTVPAVRMARRMSIPYVLSPHGGLEHLGKRAAKAIFDVMWGRSILENAAAVSVLTEKEKHDAVEFGAGESRVHRLANVIDASAYRDLPARTSPRQTILFLGRLNRIKGIDVLLKAFDGLQDVQLVLAGPDDGERARIRSEANILKTGFLDHDAKLQALVNSDVLVLPSTSEASPVVLYEALLCLRPAVVSSACELPMTEPAKYGVLQFKSTEAGDLREKLLFALKNRHLSDNAAVGRDFVVKHFSPEVVAEQAERIYEEAIFRGNRRSRA